MHIQFRASGHQPWQAPEADCRESVALRFPDLSLVGRSRFVMNAGFVKLVRVGQKRTTVRFDERGIEYPEASVLPVLSVEPGKGHETAECVALVQLTQVRYARAGELVDTDARSDGFASTSDMISSLASFYPRLTSSSPVCVYSFKLVAAAPAHQAPKGGVTSARVCERAANYG